MLSPISSQRGMTDKDGAQSYACWWKGKKRKARGSRGDSQNQNEGQRENTAMKTEKQTQTTAPRTRENNMRRTDVFPFFGFTVLRLSKSVCSKEKQCLRSLLSSRENEETWRKVACFLWSPGTRQQKTGQGRWGQEHAHPQRLFVQC